MTTQETSIKGLVGRSDQKVSTQRQREVLQLLAEGKTMKQAADILAVKPRTIAFHKYKMMEAFGIKRTAKLIQFAVRNRVVVT